MKKLLLFLAILLSAYFLHAQRTAQQELDRAIYLEEVDGNLDQALKLYQSIISDYPNDRSTVAEALYRTGLVNEKLGNKKAVGYYENLIKNYGDQSKQVVMARKRLNTIYAAMNTDKEKEGMIALRKTYSTPGRVFGQLSHNGKYLCQYENLNLYLVETSTGKKIPITTGVRMDSLVVNANPGTWSMDDRNHAYNWHYGKNKFGLKVYDRETGTTTTIVGPGEMIYPLNWTKDGKKILVMMGENTRIKTDINIVNLENRSIQKLFSRPTSLWQDGASISPDGQYVVHTLSSAKGDKDLYVFSLKNGTNHLISDHSANEDQAIWTNDSKSIIFRSDRSGELAFYRWNYENGQMLNDPDLIYEGVNKNINLQGMTPDGEIILVNFIRNASIKLAEVNFQNGQVIAERELVDDALKCFYPAFSPEGHRISMVKKSEGSSSDLLIITDIDGNKEKEIALEFNVPIGEGNGSYWTSDGKIVITQRRASDELKNSFILLNPESGELEIIQHPFIPNRPFVDGEKSYYFSVYNKLVVGEPNDQFRGIYKFDATTGEEALIYKCPENMRLGWDLIFSPDRGQLIFNLMPNENEHRDKCSAMLMNLDDLSVQELYRATEPQGTRMGNFYWHPDGKRITFAKVPLDKIGFGEPTRQAQIELDLSTGQIKLLPAFELGVDQTYQWQRAINYEIHPDGDKIIYRDARSITNFWTLKF